MPPTPDATPTAFDDDFTEEIGRHFNPIEPGHVQIGIDTVEQLAGHWGLLSQE